VVRLASSLRRLLLGLADRLLPAHIAVVEHAHAFAVAHLLAAVAELGVADQLVHGPKTADQLAPLIGADTEALQRVLRASAVVGIVRLDRAGRFHETRLTRPLRTGHPSAAGEWCRYIGSPSLQAAWAHLAETVCSGDSAFRRVHRTDLFSWFTAHPDEGRHFTLGLGGLTRSEAAMIIAAYPFPDRGVVCDVAGGHGVLLGEILRAHPALRGILVESPLVLAEAKSYFDALGIGDRVELVEGDFFDGFEARADVYVLKWILHDWDDPTCERIIGKVSETMPSGSKLVVIEGEQKTNVPDPRFSMIDAQMLVVTDGGREREGTEIETLVTKAGLTLGTRRHTATDLLLVEASIAG
jgi:hypothetical protein